MESLPDRFKPLMAGNLRTTIQFNFTGEKTEFWVLTIANGSCSVAEGLVETADATVTMSAVDFIGINSGERPAPEIFWGGAIDIEGNVDAVIGLAPIMDWQ